MVRTAGGQWLRPAQTVRVPRDDIAGCDPADVFVFDDTGAAVDRGAAQT
jgi:hypothetical protein